MKLKKGERGSLPMDGAWREICCSRDNLKLSRPIPVLENIVRIWTGNTVSRVPYDGPRTEKNKHLLLILNIENIFLWSKYACLSGI